jgi:hypothetical protein
MRNHMLTGHDQAADLIEAAENRVTRSTIVAAQFPVNLWHEGLGDPTMAATLDRLLERTYRIQLVGRSRRRRAETT